MAKRIFLLFLLFTSYTLFAQPTQKFDSLLNSFHQNGLFEGSILIADDTGIVYQNAFGIANHDYKIPNTLNTIFGIGSLSKPFTSMLVLQLIQEGKLGFDVPISNYLPDYRKDIGSKVTIRHLLTHTSGIPSYTALPNVWEDSMQLSYTSGYILKNFGSRDLEYEPGTKYKYGNTGYFILAMIIERVTGKSLAEVLRERIFVPLKMSSSGLHDNKTPIENKASGYYRLGNQYINESYIYNLNTFGASGVHSTVHDLYLWDRALYTEKLLSSDNMRLYTSPHFKVAPDYSYGFGWEFTSLPLAKDDTLNTMEHSGAIRGFRANMFRVPSERKCVIILSNSANQSAYELFENIMQIFRGRNWRAPKKLLADTLFTEMQNTSAERAVGFYKKMKATDSASYDYSSYALELLGERLLMLSMYPEAAAIFKLAVEEYPTYTYGYLYLGRAFEKWGKRKEAIEAYQQAVAQDKNSRPGIDAAFRLRQLSLND